MAAADHVVKMVAHPNEGKLWAKTGHVSSPPQCDEQISEHLLCLTNSAAKSKHQVNQRGFITETIEELKWFWAERQCLHLVHHRPAKIPSALALVQPILVRSNKAVVVAGHDLFQKRATME